MSSITNSDLSSDKFNTLLTSVPKGADVKITLTQPISKPPFIMVGSGVIGKKGASMNYTKMLLGLSKPAGFMFEAVMDNRVPELNEYGEPSLYLKTNYSNVQPDPADKVAVKYFTLGYKELLEKNMLVRIKRGQYLINPSLIISGNNWVAEQIVYTNTKRKLEGSSVLLEPVITETKIVRRNKLKLSENPIKYGVGQIDIYPETYDNLKETANASNPISTWRYWLI